MENGFVIGKGILKFDLENRTKKHNKQSSWKRTAMILTNDDTYQYYQWFIEKRFPLVRGVNGDTNWINPPLRGSHVTIINDRISDINNWNRMKDKYDNTEMFFFMDIENGLRISEKHIYYKVMCPIGDEVREFGNLGDPYYGFHLTVGTIPEESIIPSDHLDRVRKILINTK